MAISWATIKSLVFLLGPILGPKAYQYYRSARAAPAIHGIPIRPVPSNVSRALGILFVTAIGFFLKTLPPFSPENIFNLTSSRLQIPNDVLFTRLSALRPAGLSPADEILRSKINSLESRLLYFQFGGDVITNCQFCTAEDPKSYLYYSLPAILAPYLFNICVMALVTSGLFTGKEGAVWRTTATIAGVVIPLFEIYLVSSYNHQENARATRLEDIDAFFWKMRFYRNITIAAADGLLGWMLYLSSTNRAFLTPPTTAERVETSTRLVEMARSKIQSLGILRNSIYRDADLRNQSQDYWVHEGLVRGQIMEEREVIDSVNNALENRIDMRTITSEAASYAEAVVSELPSTPGI